MAGTVQVGDIIAVRHEFSDGSNVAYNVFDYEVTQVTDEATGLPAAVGVPFQEAAPIIGNAMYEAFKVPWGTLAVENVQYTSVTIQSVDPAPRSRPYTLIPVDPQEGTRTGDPLPLQDTVTFLKRSAYGERWGLGRMFFVGLSESDQSGGTMSNAWRDLAVAQAPSFGADILAAGDDYSFQLKPRLWRGPTAPEPKIVPIVEVQLSNAVIKTQRRRRPGKGI